MRDLLVILIVFGSLPVALVRPHFGILMWTWLSLMNPHRLTWGLAQSLRVALPVAVVTLAAWLFSHEPKRPPRSIVVVLLAIFTAWLTFCQFFALMPDLAWEKWAQVVKILLMTFVTMCIVHGRSRIDQLVWVTAISLGYYGLRGGVFTILSGGENRVWGPPDSFIDDNNQLAMALVMTLPLMRYLELNTARTWVRLALWGAMGLTIIAVLGTYSRGGFLALGMTLVVLWWKTPHRIITGSLIGALMAISFLAAPAKWYDRMRTIETYEEDASAQDRLFTWRFAWNLARDHPVVGGGFRVFYDEETFSQYAPEGARIRNAHSIYFEVLAETGFVGLGLFVALGLAGFFTSGRTARLSRGREDLAWARRLARMLQVSLVGYATAGTFLNLGFFDLYYTLLAIIVATHEAVRRTAAEAPGSEALSANALGEPASLVGR